ncbi:hypothetical protein GTO10_06060 [Candidatus Saccharibacteria bacterium]|nr:hypothetical protein [Candidatus Saccharibacteria bacterium]
MELQKYKLIAGLKPDISAAQSKRLSGKIETAAKKAGGKVVKSSSRGIKSLAYQVGGSEQANFEEFILELPKGKVGDLKREILQAEGFLRSMVVKIKEG